MKPKGEKIMKQFLFTTKFGVLVLGMFAVLCVPHIVLAAHGQSHSEHFHPFSHAAGYLAEKENKVIAVLTLVYWNGMVHGFHAAALEEYFDCCPNNILHMEAIRDAINNNYRYYDFGASGEMEGVIRFKESMGAERREFTAGHWKFRRTKKMVS